MKKQKKYSINQVDFRTFLEIFGLNEKEENICDANTFRGFEHDTQHTMKQNISFGCAIMKEKILNFLSTYPFRWIFFTIRFFDGIDSNRVSQKYEKQKEESVHKSQLASFGSTLSDLVNLSVLRVNAENWGVGRATYLIAYHPWQNKPSEMPKYFRCSLSFK